MTYLRVLFHSSRILFNFLLSFLGYTSNIGSKQGIVSRSYTSSPDGNDMFSSSTSFEKNLKSITDSFVSLVEQEAHCCSFRSQQPLTTFAPLPVCLPTTQEQFRTSCKLIDSKPGDNFTTFKDITDGINALNEANNSNDKPVIDVIPQREAIVKEPESVLAKDQKVTFNLPAKQKELRRGSSSEASNGGLDISHGDVDHEDVDDPSSTTDISGITVKCRNPACTNIDMLENAKVLYKTCHNCSVFYCTRNCRRDHWSKHKKFCEKIKASNAITRAMGKIRNDSNLLEIVSSVAQRGNLTVGRGAVKLFFNDIAAAEAFINDKKIPEAHYLSLQNILPQEMGSEIYKKLIQQCKMYNPLTKFLLYISICTYSETPTHSSSKCRRETVGKYIKLKLVESSGNENSTTSTPYKKSHLPDYTAISNELNEPETLILAAFPNHTPNMHGKRKREIVFNNINRILLEKGVNLKTHHIDIYRKLLHFAEVGSGSVSPLKFQPKNSLVNKDFICIIMVEANPSRIQQIKETRTKVTVVDVSKLFANVP